MSHGLIVKCQEVVRDGVRLTVSSNAIGVDAGGNNTTFFVDGSGTVIEKEAPKPKQEKTEERRKIIKEQPVKKD